MDLKRHNYVCHFKVVPGMLLKFYDDFGFIPKERLHLLFVKTKKERLENPNKIIK